MKETPHPKKKGAAKLRIALTVLWFTSERSTWGEPGRELACRECIHVTGNKLGKKNVS